jgi:hypothetical protein
MRFSSRIYLIRLDDTNTAIRNFVSKLFGVFYINNNNTMYYIINVNNILYIYLYKTIINFVLSYFMEPPFVAHPTYKI